MATGNLRDAISGVDLFSMLDAAAVDNVVQAGTRMTYRPGATIVAQGALGGGFHLFLDGGGEVVVNGDHRRDLGVGDYFGEMSLFDSAPRSATIRAGEDGATTFTLSPMAVGAVLDENPRAARVVLSALAKRVREVENRPAKHDA